MNSSPSFRRVWPMSIVKELIERAQIHGFAETELSSPKEAELFRYAVKNYKRRHNVGGNLMTNTQGSSVIVRKQPEVKLKETVQ
jgi:hypothetical protein